jgi:hypothetical protein
MIECYYEFEAVGDDDVLQAVQSAWWNDVAAKVWICISVLILRICRCMNLIDQDPKSTTKGNQVLTKVS